ncbi:hypothetical protein JW933_09150 [candidate division FCPU426 bacterium]|nr:hypothetical protein [candidate division FCPU426 bacterium]
MKAWRIAILCLICLGVSAHSQAEKIMVVLSRSILPYEQAWEGFSRTIQGGAGKMDMAGDKAQGERIMQKISAESVDLVVTIGSEATLAACSSLSKIPVIYTMVLEPPEGGGSSAKGLLMQVKTERQMEVLSRFVPNNKGIGVIYNIYYSGSIVNQAREIAKKMNLTLFPIAVETEADVPKVLQKLTPEKVGVLWMVVDPTTTKPEIVQEMIKYTLKEKMAFMALSRYHVKAGAFAALSVDYNDMGAQTAEITRKFLAGQAVRNVEFPRKLILYVNTETQKRLEISDLPSLNNVQIIRE